MSKKNPRPKHPLRPDLKPYWLLNKGYVVIDPKWDEDVGAYVGVTGDGERVKIPFSPKMMQVFTSEIRGFLTNPQGMALFAMASSTAQVPGDVIEVGTFAGLAAAWIAFALKANPLDKRTLHCIDPFVGVPDKDLPTPGEWRSNLARLGVLDVVHLHMQTSEAVAAAWGRPISMVFIDGDHRPPAVKHDVTVWGEKVATGGVLVLHDTGDPDYPGVQAMCEALDAQGERWEPLNTPVRMRAWRKR